MEELYNYGFSEFEIKEILQNNQELLDIKKEEVKEKIDILKNIGCNEVIIKNIIITNIFYLNRITKDILLLINKLNSLNIKNLNIIFDSNPFLLNKEDYEIDNFINEKLNLGYTMEDIIDIIESNLFELDW